MRLTRGRLAFPLALLFGLNFTNFYDRQVVGAIGERIKVDWHLSDGQLGSLTTAFILLYAVVGIPLGRWADRGRRRIILGVGAIVWSLFTALSGVAWGFASLFAFRIGVGVGEASCAPTANSLLGDLFPWHQRSRAISLFMLGLPLGTSASFLVSGAIAQATGGWRPALFVAAVPGVVLGLLAFLLPEPERGAAEAQAAARPLEGSAIGAILRIPTMWWIILSGALINLNLYALAAFLTSFMIRYHGLGIGGASRFNALITGLGGGVGMLAGGWLGDRAARGGVQRRLLIAAGAFAVAAPTVWVALQQPRGAAWSFVLLMGPGLMFHYMYYSTVYATIQDVVEPERRGTAMAIYFFAFYFATAIGLYALGHLSDLLTARAARGGASPADASALGLHDALYTIPIVAAVLALVLWVGARTVAGDHSRMLERRQAAPAR